MANKAKEETISLYIKSGWKSIFSHIRFWDAPLVEVEKLIPKKGIITELGCGDGIFSNYLAVSAPGRQVLGIDIDKNRITVADKGLKNTKYVFGDIRKITIPLSDTLILFHVLHHLGSHKEQEGLIRACKRKLKKNGVLLIVEIHMVPSFKYALGWFFDHFLVPVFFEKRLYSKIYYRTEKGWQKLLKDIGFSTHVVNLTSGKPISNIAIIGKNE